MIKLLNAGFTRLRKNKLFWLLTILSIGVALFMIYSGYSDMNKYGRTIEVEKLMLNYSTMVGVVIAIFTSLFLGVEYSDGAMRNKISIGHKRKNIYLSNLIITSIVSIFFYALFILITIAIGIPLFGVGTVSISVILKQLLVLIFVILAYCSIFTFVSLICSNKTIISITTILLAFGMLLFATYCYNILTTPEYIKVAVYEDGETKFKEEYNPKYPSPTKRKVYQTLLDIDPAGQSIQIQERVSNLEILIVYSIGLIVVFTSSGLVLFKKKEIK